MLRIALRVRLRYAPLRMTRGATTVELAMLTKNFPRVKVFSQVFFKKLAGFGAEPHKKLQT